MELGKLVVELKMTDFREFKKEVLKDPKARKAYRALDGKYKKIRHQIREQIKKRHGK